MATVKGLKVPRRTYVRGRTTSISSAFANAVIPRLEPTFEEKVRALKVLGIDENDVTCAYCGDPATEWDHFRATVKDKELTGWGTEIANLVPSCGKCNQSKGNKPWEQWMRSGAPKSPTSRNVHDIEERIEALSRFEGQHAAVQHDRNLVLGHPRYGEYRAKRDEIVRLMNEADTIAAEIQEYLAHNLE